jgi:predicted aspartyl protease
MGRVVTEALIENSNELWAVEKGWLKAEEVHRVTVSEALVDTGATRLSLPISLIQNLALTRISDRSVLNSSGSVNQATVYGAVRLTIQGRECHVDVLEVPDNVPVLIGQVPLELLDFVVDPKNQCLIGNPAHGGEQMSEQY